VESNNEVFETHPLSLQLEVIFVVVQAWRKFILPSTWYVSHILIPSACILIWFKLP